MKLAINKLLNLGAVTKCEPSNDQFISRSFLAPKPNGDKRFILNLKPLNKFIPKSHFKMEDSRTACKLIPKNGFLANIDLKEAYLSIPVSTDYRKYLRFQFPYEKSSNLDTFEFTAMPYGLSIAPRVFSKIIKEVVTELRKRGLKSVFYLDDYLCIGNTYSECLTNVNETIKLFQSLGFVINFDKSTLEPKQKCKFLGFIFDSTDLSISLPQEKRLNIITLLNSFKLHCSIRDFAKLIGTLTSACPATKYGWMYTKILERQKFLALQRNLDYDAKITLPNIVSKDINWWLDNLSTCYNHMRPNSFKMVIHTDASLSGWGAFCNGLRANGRWRPDELIFHINYLELLAVFMALKTFCKNETSNCSILLRVDNTTAISYVNRMGGVQYSHLNDLSRAIWQWCEERNIWLFASYINSKDNHEADEESRRINPDIEWELSNKAFGQIVQKFGTPEIDLFASRTTAKCSNYVAWKPDPDAIAIDAFTIFWGSYFYAFPPFSMLLKTIRKIIENQAVGILVFPVWPSQPWYPLLQEILVSEVIIFEPNKNLLHSCYRPHHPLYNQLTLGAAKVCGRLS